MTWRKSSTRLLPAALSASVSRVSSRSPMSKKLRSSSGVSTAAVPTPWLQSLPNSTVLSAAGSFTVSTAKKLSSCGALGVAASLSLPTVSRSPAAKVPPTSPVDCVVPFSVSCATVGVKAPVPACMKPLESTKVMLLVTALKSTVSPSPPPFTSSVRVSVPQPFSNT
ncbi:MAG: hypothetical protein K0R03_3 [Moraxellaceae bacterium]|nr:hypothetical protein [Moraxellaceae bacterium]